MRSSRPFVAVAALLLLAGCEQTLVGPEAQQASEEARDSRDFADRHGEPLIMVDGVVVLNGAVKKLDAESIDRIEVIKGKTAVQKFGDRARDGAILIFTKDARDESESRGT